MFYLWWDIQEFNTTSLNLVFYFANESLEWKLIKQTSLPNYPRSYLDQKVRMKKKIEEDDHNAVPIKLYWYNRFKQTDEQKKVKR